MTESDLPPTHRRRWRLWTDPSHAVTEWHELAVLADDLHRASVRLLRIGKGMHGSMPGASRITWMSSTLLRMSLRWEARSRVARADAVRDHAKMTADNTRDKHVDWMLEQDRQIAEEKAVTIMSRALEELEAAEHLLDEATAQQIRRLRAPLDEIYGEIYNRDVRRQIEMDWGG